MKFLTTLDTETRRSGIIYPISEGDFGACETCANAGESTPATFRQHGIAVKATASSWQSHAGRVTDSCYDCLACYQTHESSEIVEHDQMSDAVATLRSQLD